MMPRRDRRKGLLAAAAAVITALVLLAAVVSVLNVRGQLQGPRVAVLQPGPQQDPALVARGRELSLIGHCAACHTAPGGHAYAGGHAVQTPSARYTAATSHPMCRQDWASGRRRISGRPCTTGSRVTDDG